MSKIEYDNPLAQNMDLRDFFAAQVLQGMYAYSARADDGYDPGFDDSDFEEIAADDPHQPKYYKPKSRGYWIACVSTNMAAEYGNPHKCVRTYEQRVARNAYAQADAMLAARSSPTPNTPGGAS